jgi:hypothetical protein
VSTKNGDRARFHRQRRTKLHNRTRIRDLRKRLRLHKAGSEREFGSKRTWPLFLPIEAGIKMLVGCNGFHLYVATFD